MVEIEIAWQEGDKEERKPFPSLLVKSFFENWSIIDWIKIIEIHIIPPPIPSQIWKGT